MALIHSNRPVSRHFHEAVHQKIKSEVTELEKNQTFLKHTPQVLLTDLLRHVLQRKINRSIERLLLFLAIDYRNLSVMQIKTQLLKNRVEDISYPLELLEGILKPEHKKIIIPVLIALYLTENKKFYSLQSAVFHSVLREHLHVAEEDYLSILACIASLYIIKTIGVDLFSTEIAALKDSKSAIIQETLDWLDNFPIN